MEPRSGILETLCEKVLVPKEGPKVSPAPRADMVALVVMSLVMSHEPDGAWRKPLCCSDFPEVFVSYMDLPLWLVRHGISFPVAAGPNSTCIFPVEIIMPF